MAPEGVPFLFQIRARKLVKIDTKLGSKLNQIHTFCRILGPKSVDLVGFEVIDGVGFGRISGN